MNTNAGDPMNPATLPPKFDPSGRLQVPLVAEAQDRVNSYVTYSTTPFPAPPQTATTVYEHASLDGPITPGDLGGHIPNAWKGTGRLTVHVTWEPEA